MVKYDQRQSIVSKCDTHTNSQTCLERERESNSLFVNSRCFLRQDKERERVREREREIVCERD